MSRRPTTDKKLARLRKALSVGQLQAHIDLVDYLKERRYAQSTGQAKAMLLAGKVRAGANVVGRSPDPNAKAVPGQPDMTDGFVLQRTIPARLRGEIQVLP